MHLIYSRERHALADGKKLQNPRHFTGPVEGAKSVTIVGTWPEIEEAYRAAGVQVELVDQPTDPAAATLSAPPASLKNPARKARPKGKSASKAKAKPAPAPAAPPVADQEEAARQDHAE